MFVCVCVCVQRQQADLMVTAAVEEMRNKLSSLLNVQSEAGIVYTQHII